MHPLYESDPDQYNANRSELASKILEAFNGNTHYPTRVALDTAEDIRVGPLTFRWDDRRTRKRWYIVE